jgi:putative flippase GtrA
MASNLSNLARRARDPGIAGQITRFVIVGSLGFIVDAGILRSAVYLGAGSAVGRIISLSFAVTSTWYLNRTMTFASSRLPTLREYVHYVLNSLVGMVISFLIYSCAVFWNAPLLLGVALGTIAASLFNFIRYRVLLSDSETPATPPS